MCPNCRYRIGEDQVYNVPVFKGDRILVTKFSFETKDPQRFDVVVFKYPEEPKINYIKRCIGLPNETLEDSPGGSSIASAKREPKSCGRMIPTSSGAAIASL